MNQRSGIVSAAVFLAVSAAAIAGILASGTGKGETYIGTGSGRNGDITVSVTVKDGALCQER